jgi:hypothetical protein
MISASNRRKNGSWIQAVMKRWKKKSTNNEKKKNVRADLEFWIQRLRIKLKTSSSFPFISSREFSLAWWIYLLVEIDLNNELKCLTFIKAMNPFDWGKEETAFCAVGKVSREIDGRREEIFWDVSDEFHDENGKTISEKRDGNWNDSPKIRACQNTLWQHSWNRLLGKARAKNRRTEKHHSDWIYSKTD